MDESIDILKTDALDEETALEHYGTPRHSGRYPWGSGNKAYQRNANLIARNLELKKQGFSERERYLALGCKSASELRAKIAYANAENDAYNTVMIQKLKDKGYSNVEIGKRMGVSEGMVRNVIKRGEAQRQAVNQKITTCLKEEVAAKGMVDVGKGSNLLMNVTENRFKDAVEMLKLEGYQVHTYRQQQAGTGKHTTMMVLTDKDTDWKTMYKNRDQIGIIGQTFVEDGGYGEITRIHPPKSIDSKRVYIRYAEEGGVDRDGTIELRRGVKDLDLGNAKYAQVRVAVDDTGFMKGIAHYSDNIPDGYDVIYNTNKPKGSPNSKVFKPLKDDPKNPFGATISRQNDYEVDGKKHEGVLNVIREEGEWDTWSKTLASQMLSKQPVALAKRQLGLTIKQKEEMYEDIMNINNPIVKRKALLDFGEQCDADAVSLKAAAMPRQTTSVIVPITSLKDNECYAPKYKDGETLALIRYPHGGKFEIPEVIVNNKNKEGQRVLGNPKDAIGINSTVAGILSGADFDGDTVICIPNNSKAIKNQKPFDELKNFDTKASYPKVEGMKAPWAKGSKTEGKQMGIITNLINDMSLAGAPPEHIIRAVKHSMVIIDTGKHELNWKQSEIDNGIAELHKLYQGKATGGASTLISRSKSEANVPYRQDRYSIDPETGEKQWFYKPETYTDKHGKVQERTTKSTKMAEAKDARELISTSHYEMEEVYADYANHMKDMGNRSRLQYLAVEVPRRDSGAAKKYADQVASLDEKLRVAESNAPLERKAHVLVGQRVAIKREANPNMSKEELKKLRGQELERAREEVGANKKKVYIDDSEWEAIQNNAITPTKLSRILNNVNKDRLNELAYPKQEFGLSSAKQATAKAMLESGHTIADVADHFGVSASTITKLV